MVNCLHYLFQWIELKEEQLKEPYEKRRFFWAGPDTRYSLELEDMLLDDPQTSTIKLQPGIFNLIKDVEDQLQSMPKPNYVFGYPLSEDIRSQGDERSRQLKSILQ
jgi:hypothetical protein